MKIVIPGGSGNVGSVLRRQLEPKGHEIAILTRGDDGVRWDGKTLGEWVSTIDSADVVINLAGRTVNCRYNETKLAEMMSSRVDSTRVIGQAIAAAKKPPRVWLQASTATIYAHRFDVPNDESTGIIGGDEPGVPALWGRSVDIAKAWEAELDSADTPNTRKIAMRSAITFSTDSGSAFDILYRLSSCGLGGTIASGKQYVSWIYELDFARAVEFLIAREDLSGPVNVCSPNPLPQKQFARAIRGSIGARGALRIGLPAPRPILEIACRLMGTESELVLKSRRVVPSRLLDAGFEFKYPNWPDAAQELVNRIR